ncbi:MAG: hypothetical protein ACREYD_04740 [Casimicrobiaceae bacterium]
MPIATEQRRGRSGETHEPMHGGGRAPSHRDAIGHRYAASLPSRNAGRCQRRTPNLRLVAQRDIDAQIMHKIVGTIDTEPFKNRRRSAQRTLPLRFDAGSPGNKISNLVSERYRVCKTYKIH